MNEVKKGKVVHLTSVHFPLDTRIFYKECVTLQRAGYEVVLVAPHVHSETVDNISIHAVPKPKNRRDRILKTIGKFIGRGSRSRLTCIISMILNCCQLGFC